MSMSTAQERRQRTIRRFAILGALLAIVLLFILSQAARSDALAAISWLENLRDTKGATATIAVTVLIFLAIIENAEKLHFLWEMGHKILGYDLEEMAKHEREFTDLPEDYVRRPVMERALAEQFAPADEPKLVVFTEEHDAGKTTIMNYVIPRQLTRPYRGNVILCRGDMQSIDVEIGESEEQRRRRLAKRVLERVIRHAEVPGDTGETVQGMREAITEHFEREGEEPWLIIIDQVDNPSFPYNDVLPALFGQCNTVVVVSNRADIPQSAYTVKREDDDEERVVLRRDVHLQPFTADEALRMFRAEVRERRGALNLAATTALKPYLEGVWPGTVQRLSDIFVNGGGLPGVERALSPSTRGVRRARVINSTIVDELPGELRHFLAGLALLGGATVGVKTLAALAETGLCADEPLARLTEECCLRQYLTRVNDSLATRHGPAAQRYTITKLGRGIATRALLMVGHNAELRLGSALLNYFRGLETYDDPGEALAELPNILAMMAWAESTSRLPETDVIRFTRYIREALYRSGQWEIGLSWLAYSERSASRLSLMRSVGELAASRGQLLMATGRVTSAMGAVEDAQQAFAKSILRVESDLAMGVVDEEISRAVLDYDALQRCWVIHLRVMARKALLTAKQDMPALDKLNRELDEAFAWLSAAREKTPANAAIAPLFAATLTLDRVQLALWKGDALFRSKRRKQAIVQWRAAHAILQEAQVADVSSNERTVEASRDLLAEIKRTEAAIFRRYAARSPALVRQYWYVRASRHLTTSLQLARGIRLEEALTRFESAELQLVGIRLATRRWRAIRGQWIMRRIFTRLLPQWYRLQSAHRQLQVANAGASSLGAQSLQFAILRTLASVTNQLAGLERNIAYLRASEEYSQSAHSIAYRLSAEMPNLWSPPSSALPNDQFTDGDTGEEEAVSVLAERR